VLNLSSPAGSGIGAYTVALKPDRQYLIEVTLRQRYRSEGGMKCAHDPGLETSGRDG
jgi:hypothetical protein